MWQPGWEGGLGMNGCLCMYMAESLPCSPETIPALLIGYNPMQNKKFFKKEIFYWILLEKIIYLLFCEFCLVCHQCCYNVQFCKNNFFGLDFPFCFQICSFQRTLPPSWNPHLLLLRVGLALCLPAGQPRADTEVQMQGTCWPSSFWRRSASMTMGRALAI